MQHRPVMIIHDDIVNVSTDSPTAIKNDEQFVLELRSRCDAKNNQDLRVWVRSKEKARIRALAGYQPEPKKTRQKNRRIRIATLRLMCNQAMEKIEQRAAAQVERELVPQVMPQTSHGVIGGKTIAQYHAHMNKIFKLTSI